MNSAERFSYIHARVPISTYLEIGVKKGKTFHQVPFQYKDAVDPKFGFTPEDSAHTKYFQEGSDQYFERHAGDRTFDLIFIDGLHHWEQALRDFENALSHVHERSLIVVDDVYPCDEFSVMRDQEAAIAARLKAAPNSKYAKAWHGDVFKTAFAIHDHFPQVDYLTIDQDFGNPQMFCWLEKGTGRKRALPELSALSEFTFADFLAHRELLKLMDEGAALDKVVASLRGLAEQ
jgi:hypothetical protein